MTRRGGHRKGRDQRKKRKFELKKYLIITDGEKTEVNYFNGLKNSLPEDIREKIKIEIIKSESPHTLILDAMNKISRYPYYEVWLVFDKDEVRGFDKIIREAYNSDFKVGWSNPCIEIWFLSYFGANPNTVNSKQCINVFSEYFRKKVNKDYLKNDEKIYQRLIEYGNEDLAIKISRNRLEEYLDECVKPSMMNGANRVFELVEEIRNAE